MIRTTSAGPCTWSLDSTTIRNDSQISLQTKERLSRSGGGGGVTFSVDQDEVHTVLQLLFAIFPPARLLDILFYARFLRLKLHFPYGVPCTELRVGLILPNSRARVSLITLRAGARGGRPAERLEGGGKVSVCTRELATALHAHQRLPKN